MKMAFYKHDLGQPELDAIAKVFAGTILTTGDTVAEFEQRFGAYLGRGHVVGLNSCTGALHIALIALGVRPGDEVITTPLTFLATSAAIAQAGAIPVYVDVEPDTGNMDASRVEAAITPRTRAIMPVHLYGQLCDMRALREAADRHNLVIVEDAAHCIEGERDGVRVGDLSEASCFSFYATKNLTCGEGGAVATDDGVLAAKLRLLRLHGMTRTAADRDREGYKTYDMVMLGWKYNMDNIDAAILLPQLERLDRRHLARETVWQRYYEKLASIPGVTWPSVRPGRHGRHLFTIWIDPALRNTVVEGLTAAGIPVVVNYRSLSFLSYIRDTFRVQAGQFPIAERIGESTISLPFYPGMPEEDVDLVTMTLGTVLGQTHPFQSSAPR
jgi:dTDP-4-amino-4,6-dideoxygalactose transaminase